jgi:transposase IS66 family protein
VHALKLLDHDRGIMQCDGYAAYKSIAGSTNGEAITLAFCWAHLRRGFFDIAKGGNAPIASEALERIAALYAIEKPIRGKSAGERRAVRQEKSKPLVLELKTWLEQQLTRVSGGCGFLFGRDGFILTVTASQRLANWGSREPELWAGVGHAFVLYVWIQYLFKSVPVAVVYRRPLMRFSNQAVGTSDHDRRNPGGFK